MKQTISKITFAAAVLAATGGQARAGGSPGTIGVGAEFQLNGVGGASANYDAGDFHLGGALGFRSEENAMGDSTTTFVLGGRFFYHVHSTAMSDFGVGGGVGVASKPDPMDNDDRETDLFIEPAIQVRLFVASNVAISLTAGLFIGVMDADDDGVAITGATVGSMAGAGFHYYFF